MISLEAPPAKSGKHPSSCMDSGSTSPDPAAPTVQPVDPLSSDAEMIPSASSEDGAGAAYLRHLKGPEHSVLPEPSARSSSTPSGSTSSGIPERRRSIRYKCQGSAEFRHEGSDVRIWGTLMDISQHGCYVELMATSAVGSIVNLVLALNEIRAQVKGEVRVSYPCLGMGIAFTEISPEEQVHLREQLRSLSEPPPVPAVPPLPVAAAASHPEVPMAVIGDPTAALNAIVRFFQSNALLTRRDFQELVRKS